MMDFDEELPTVLAGSTNNRVHFFKYMSEGTAKIVLKNRTLRWSTASLLNDPFEMQFDLSLKADRDRVRDGSLNLLWKIYKSGEPMKASNVLGIAFEWLRRSVPNMSAGELFAQFGPAIEKGLDIIQAKSASNTEELLPMFAKVKIVSLTTRPDNKLMWAHYSNAHRGVVLRFRSIHGLDSPLRLALPVKYTSDPPEFFNEQFLINAFCGIETMDVTDAFNRVIFRKSAEWEYEQEWRMHSGFGRERDADFEDVKFGWNELDGVIFGINTSEADKVELRKLCEPYPNVQFMRSSKLQGTSGLDISLIG